MISRSDSATVCDSETKLWIGTSEGKRHVTMGTTCRVITGTALL